MSDPLIAPARIDDPLRPDERPSSEAASPGVRGVRGVRDLGRRYFLQRAGGALAATSMAAGFGAVGESLAQAQEKPISPSLPNAGDYVDLRQLHAATEQPEHAPGPFDAPDQRVGFAIVGIGHLSINQILPAFGHSKYCKPVALVSGSPDKARKVAAQYGIKPTSIYDYEHYEQLAHNPDVRVIYIVLPNSMHAEYVNRGAKIGKHILCEKPMATSATDCERMIEACKAARVKLMIAYRQQYEPMNREIAKMVRSGKLGSLRSIIATNTQNEGPPDQWRLQRALSGGGCLPDVGIYCLNAARFLSSEEPSEVFGAKFQPDGHGGSPADPRFTQVEATCSFMLRFPSGLIASCNSGFAGHRSQFLRLEGSEAFAELNPAFGYHGLKLRTSRVVDERDNLTEPSFEDKDQFALEMDHMALCVLNGQQPHTPGEEGLADQRLIEAIYESAGTGRAVRVPPPAGPTRGPEPQDS
jgi:predicted dehydrogenase